MSELRVIRDGELSAGTAQTAGMQRSAAISGDIVGAMGSFSGNWDYHRDKLVSSMQALGKMISESSKQFHGTDNQLASSLKQKTQK